MSEPQTLAVFEGHDRGSRPYRRILVALFFAGIATFAQLYSVQGVLPLLSRDLGVAPAQAALTVSAATIGLAIGVLPWSWAADRLGRLTVMKLSLTAAVVAGLIVPFCPGLASVLAMRVVEGFALGGVPAIAVTYLHEEISRAWAAVAAGTYVSGTTLGGLLGRVVAAPIGEAAGWRIGILTVALVSAAAAIGFALLVPAPQGFVRRPGRREANRGQDARGSVPETAATGAAPASENQALVSGRRQAARLDPGVVSDPPDSPTGAAAPASLGAALASPGAALASASAARASLGRTIARQLRTPGLLVLFAQGLLLMGGFVAVYNYLSFRLEADPFDLTASETALLFFAYLAGTVSSRVAGSLVVRVGRHTVLVGSIGVMIIGVLMTLAPSLVVIVPGLVVMTAGFFGAHSVASGWVGARAIQGRAQASSLYNLFYYAGSSLFGWAGGFAFAGFQWPGVVFMVTVLAAIAGAWALVDAARTRRAAPLPV